MEVAIHSRRQIISGLTLVLLSGFVPLGASSASARDGGKGGGNGGGRSGGGNGGNSGGGGGAGSGNNSGGRGTGRSGNRGAGSDTSAGTSTKASRSLNDSISVGDGGIKVTHGSGIAEEVNDRGRYVMRDRSGRTIVNRAATQGDLDRLRSLIK